MTIEAMSNNVLDALQDALIAKIRDLQASEITQVREYVQLILDLENMRPQP